MARHKKHSSTLDPVIEAARRNRHLLRRLPRFDQLRNVYRFALHQWPLMVERPLTDKVIKKERAFPTDSRSLTRDELILFALARREFNMDVVREMIATDRTKLTDAERDHHIRRRQAQAQEVIASWYSPDAQHDLELDEETGQFLRHVWTTRSAGALNTLLQDMYDRDVDFLEQGTPSPFIWIRRNDRPTPKKLKMERARPNWFKRWRALQTAILAAGRLNNAVQALPPGDRQTLFSYYGASAQAQRLQNALHTPYAAKLLTASIVSAESANVGSVRFVADDRLRRDILAVI